MDDARIASLLRPFLGRDKSEDALSAGQLKDISMYVDILLRWNARINLTAVRAPEEIVTRHFGESIFAARHLFPKGESQPGTTPHVIDVGSGAGFPGLPIKIWAPQVRVTLIESNQKKATFLREVVRGLGLVDVEVFGGRANDFPGAKGDVVTLRAVERFESVVSVAAGLVARGGRLALLIGAAQVLSGRKLLPAIEWDESVNIPLSQERMMIIGRDESE